MFTVKINDKQVELNKPTRVLELIPQDNKDVYACKVNGRLRELPFTLDRDCTLEFLGLENNDTMLIYQNGLRYILCMAFHNLYPEVKVEFNQFISQSLSIQLHNYNGPIDQNLLDKVRNEMQRIIDANYMFKKRTVSIEEAMQIFDANGFEDKKEVTAYRPENTAHFYECNGYINYMFGYMVPSTGYLKKFNLLLYFPLLILQYPRSDVNGGEIPEFKEEQKFSRVLRKANEWAKLCGADTIANINKHTESVELVNFINMCESRHNAMLYELGELIAKDIKNIRLITIAGPSSSGKTTFSNRLKVELLNRGIKPIRLSIDNYYLERGLAPLDEDGKPDLEHIEALDIDLFNKQMLALIQGQEVTLPVFNFKTGKREQGETLKISNETPIILEGIHALNDRLTSLIPKYQKFKIFISPSNQIKLDAHNPVNLTDLRLIRRLVRDFKHRGSDATETLSMWASVRKGEFKWIYPHQDSVDFTFNSELSYEFGVLKKYAMPMLEAIPNDSPYFITANRLRKVLKYFVDIDESLVPCNSLLREFIGGSCFEKLK